MRAPILTVSWMRVLRVTKSAQERDRGARRSAHPCEVDPSTKLVLMVVVVVTAVLLLETVYLFLLPQLDVGQAESATVKSELEEGDGSARRRVQARSNVRSGIKVGREGLRGGSNVCRSGPDGVVLDCEGYSSSLTKL